MMPCGSTLESSTYRCTSLVDGFEISQATCTTCDVMVSCDASLECRRLRICQSPAVSRSLRLQADMQTETLGGCNDRSKVLPCCRSQEQTNELTLGVAAQWDDLEWPRLRQRFCNGPLPWNCNDLVLFSRSLKLKVTSLVGRTLAGER